MFNEVCSGTPPRTAPVYFFRKVRLGRDPAPVESVHR